MLFRTLFAAAALCAALSMPVWAADAPICKYTYDQVVRQISDTPKSSIYEIPPAELPKMLDDLKAIDGVDRLGITRAFIASDGSTLFLGLEQGGCLLPAIPLGPVHTKLESGANKSGMIGA